MFLNRGQPKYRQPNINAIFSLIPESQGARRAVADEENNHLVSTSLKDNVPSFDIGFHINSQTSINTLASLGRNDCDILLRPSSIAGTQCSFEIDDFNTGIIMFYDRSHMQQTRVSGETSQPFERGRSPRKILVHPDFNERISMGVPNKDTIDFKIEWILKGDQIKEAARNHWTAKKDSIVNPRKARTYDPTETTLASTLLTPDQAFQVSSPSGLRFFKEKFLGAGTFGSVWKVIDVDSGRIMAMKEIGKEKNSKAKDQDPLGKLRKEVELMRRVKHEHIVDLITSLGWTDASPSIQIFMGVEEGDVGELSTGDIFKVASGIPKLCLRQMLSALDFLADRRIVHRDVKPENVLWSRSSERLGYRFRLADFGVGNFVANAHSFQGTFWYMAPEILKLMYRSDSDAQTREQQTPKVDVWSLFVTIAYALNVCEYRSRPLRTHEEILNAARDARKDQWMSKYCSMAVEDPAGRASAFDVLHQHFAGVGVVVERSSNTDIEMSEDNDELNSAEQQARSTPSIRRSAQSSSRSPGPSRIEKRPYTRARSRATQHQMAAVAEGLELPEASYRSDQRQSS